MMGATRAAVFAVGAGPRGTPERVRGGAPKHPGTNGADAKDRQCRKELKPVASRQINDEFRMLCGWDP